MKDKSKTTTHDREGASEPRVQRIVIRRGDALELLEEFEHAPDLIVTDPPYAFGGIGGEHAMETDNVEDNAAAREKPVPPHQI